MAKYTTNKEIALLMAQIETQFSVSDWTIDGFQIWGIVRSILQNGIYTHAWPQKNTNLGLWQRIRLKFRNLFSLINLLRPYTSGLAIVCHGNHRLEINKRILHRFASYYKDARVFDFETSSSHVLLPNEHIDISAVFLFKGLVKKKGKLYCPGYDQFYTEIVCQQFPHLSNALKIDHIQNIYSNIAAMGQLMAFFLRNTKKIIIIDKARMECLAAIYAAKKLGIAIEEIQHGVFDQDDFWYTHVTYRPNYFAFEVDRMLVYQETALKAVNSTCFLKNAEPSFSVWHRVLSGIDIPKTGKNVLVALYLEQNFEGQLLAIAPYLVGHTVKLRPHPLQKQNFGVPQGWEESNKSIVQDLADAWLVISFSPTVCLDAAALGIPSVFMLADFVLESSELIQAFDLENFERQISWAYQLAGTPKI
jgi:hypothetical protein